MEVLNYLKMNLMKLFKIYSRRSFNTDYDVKLIKQTFNTSLSGVGTQSVGFVTLTGSVD